jgi:hypothetical protein
MPSPIVGLHHVPAIGGWGTLSRGTGGGGCGAAGDHFSILVSHHIGSFAPIGPGTVSVETAKVIRPNHVSGLSRINVLQCRKRCTGQQKGTPFSPFRSI